MKGTEIINRGIYTGLMAANIVFGPLIVYAGHDSYSNSYQKQFENQEVVSSEDVPFEREREGLHVSL